MQAPHSPVPQPNLVPVSLRPSRITHNSAVAGGASVDAALPFTVKFVAIRFLPEPTQSQVRRGPMNRHSLDEFWNGIDDSSRRGSPEATPSSTEHLTHALRIVGLRITFTTV